MKIAFIPKGKYTIGQVIRVHNKPMQVISYSHTGKNVVVTSLPGYGKHERIMCICTDAEPITGIQG